MLKLSRGIIKKNKIIINFQKAKFVIPTKNGHNMISPNFGIFMIKFHKSDDNILNI